MNQQEARYVKSPLVRRVGLGGRLAVGEDRVTTGRGCLHPAGRSGRKSWSGMEKRTSDGIQGCEE